MNDNIRTKIQKRAAELYDTVREYREHLHRNPELSYAEYETMEFVCSVLDSLDIPYTAGVGETGVVAEIRSAKHTAGQACIGLRADMDALPIQEANEVPYRSEKEGVMHACGHDVHTAVLLGAATILSELRDELPDPVKLIFQPGEEKNPGGATLMIRDGVLHDPEVREMYALHVFPDMPVGEVGFREGMYMASCDEIYIHVHGKGGHGATPHQAIDSILASATIVTSLQQIVSRRCDPKIPCVLSFGHFEALGATNIIPSDVYLKGTFRTMDEPWREEALKLIRDQAEHIAAAFGATADVEISRGYPVLENDPELTARMREKAVALLGVEKVHDLPIRLTSEDFSFYSREIPVCFLRLGVRNEARGIVYGVHHPRFDIDPAALVTGMEMMTIAVF